MKMRYVREVDTGELIPIPQNSETIAEGRTPRFVIEEEFPEIEIPANAFSANEIIAELTKQLEEERKRNKTTVELMKQLEEREQTINTEIVGTERDTVPLKVNKRKERMEEIYDKYNKPVPKRTNPMEVVTLLCVVSIAVLLTVVMLGSFLPRGYV